MRKSYSALKEFANKYHYRVRRHEPNDMAYIERGRALIRDEYNSKFSLWIQLGTYICSCCGSRNVLQASEHEWEVLKGNLTAWGLEFVKDSGNYGIFRFDPNNEQQAKAVQQCLESVVIMMRLRWRKKQEATESEGSHQEEWDRQRLLEAEAVGGVQ